MSESPERYLFKMPFRLELRDGRLWYRGPDGYVIYLGMMMSGLFALATPLWLTWVLRHLGWVEALRVLAEGWWGHLLALPVLLVCSTVVGVGFRCSVSIDRNEVRVVRTFLGVPWRWHSAERVIWVSRGKDWGDAEYGGTVELTLSDEREVYVGSGPSQEVLYAAVRKWLDEN